MKRWFCFTLVLLILAGILSGCGGSGGDVSNSLSITGALPTSPPTTIVGTTSDFSVTVNNPSGNALIYNWTADAGNIQDNGNAFATWQVPVTPGTYTVAVEVTDGESTVSHSWIISVILEIVNVSSDITQPTTWEENKVYLVTSKIYVRNTLP